MWPISMPRASSSGPDRVGRGIAGTDLRGLDRAVGGEVAAGDEVDDVRAVDVGAGDPARAVDDPRVDEEADAGLLSTPSAPGPM